MKDSKKFMSNPYVSVLLVVLGLAVLFSAVFAGIGLLKKDDSDESGNFKTFGSCSSMARYINENTEKNIYPPYAVDDVAQSENSARPATPAPTPVTSDGSKSNAGQRSDPDYSETNVQVEGVDEADIVKTDGEYVYVLNTDYNYGSGSKISIVNASDPSNLVVESDIEIDEIATEMFVKDDKVLVFASDNYYYPVYLEKSSYLSRTISDVLIYDISDRENPELETSYKLQGSYNTSRMVGAYVYMVSNSYFYDYSNTEVTASDVKKYIPLIADGENPNDTYKPMADCDEVSYYGNNLNSFVSITAFPLNGDDVKSKVILGDSSNVYMSTKNLYLTTVVYDDGRYEPDQPFREDYEPKITTQIFKIEADKNNFEFKSSGEVAGTVLNQFSMDEYYDYFRIATTLNDWGGWRNDSKNNMYVLDKDLNQVGEIENLAKGEQIYSVRFMGDRAFMVTFRQTDPLFAIDLKDPSDPIVLGELKIPGFSNYLHPYDENNLIGIGKDADEKTGRPEGLKIAIFDISDISNPKVKSEVFLGDNTYDSAALNDHKAFLFDKEKGLLVLPINTYDYNALSRQTSLTNLVKDAGLTISKSEVNEESILLTFGNPSSAQIENLKTKIIEEGMTAAYIENVNGQSVLRYDLNSNGFAVFSTTDAMLKLREVLNYPSELSSSYYYKPRSLYIGDNLFTNIGSILAVNKLSDLSKIDIIDMSDTFDITIDGVE